MAIAWSLACSGGGDDTGQGDPDYEPLHCDMITNDQWCREFVSDVGFDLSAAEIECTQGNPAWSGQPGLWRLGLCPDVDGTAQDAIARCVFTTPGPYDDVYYDGYAGFETNENTYAALEAACDYLGGTFERAPFPD